MVCRSDALGIGAVHVNATGQPFSQLRCFVAESCGLARNEKKWDKFAKSQTPMLKDNGGTRMKEVSHVANDSYIAGVTTGDCTV